MEEGGEYQDRRAWRVGVWSGAQQPRGGQPGVAKWPSREAGGPQTDAIADTPEPGRYVCSPGLHELRSTRD